MESLYFGGFGASKHTHSVLVVLCQARTFRVHCSGVSVSGRYMYVCDHPQEALAGVSSMIHGGGWGSSSSRGAGRRQ